MNLVLFGFLVLSCFRSRILTSRVSSMTILFLLRLHLVLEGGAPPFSSCVVIFLVLSTARILTTCFLAHENRTGARLDPDFDCSRSPQLLHY